MAPPAADFQPRCLRPLAFGPGEAFQFDWSEEHAVISGERTKLQVAHLKLCHSRAFLVRAYLLQTHEMLFDAHNHGFRVLGGVPRRGIYDNILKFVSFQLSTAWGFVLLFGFQILMLVLYPKLILPLFNKLTPLPEGELRDRRHDHPRPDAAAIGRRQQKDPRTAPGHGQKTLLTRLEIQPRRLSCSSARRRKWARCAPTWT